MTEHEAKIPLPRFLKLLTGNNVPMPKAMATAGKMSVWFYCVVDKHDLLWQHTVIRNIILPPSLRN